MELQELNSIIRRGKKWVRHNLGYKTREYYLWTIPGLYDHGFDLFELSESATMADIAMDRKGWVLVGRVQYGRLQK